MRGPMNFKLNTAAAAILAVGLVALSANASDPAATQPAKKHTTTKKAPAKREKAEPPTVEEQIQHLRREMQGQIDSLKNSLADKDVQLQKAQQAAADAQAAAARAEAAVSSENQAVTANAAAVSTLDATVTDMRSANASAVASLSDETAAIKKAIANPTTLHYKGINLTPGGYVAGETVWRSKATGGDIPTPFNAIPYEHADAYSLSEFYGSARQSRITLSADGKVSWGTLRGYYEADFLGTGITSNNNQSNSYVLRQRVIWGQAETNNHWAFTGGQLWSLATEDKKGISNLSGDIMTPQTIDPNYVTGFVWTRQYGFRVTKTFKNFAFGIAAENPQVLYTASIAGNTPYAVLGSAGANGGNYNAAISASSTTTYIQNYTTQPGTKNNGIVPVELPVYNTIVANANIANISFNEAPDFIVKAAFDPGWGHYEVFGIGRLAHETVYPNVTTDRVKYGTQPDIAGFSGGAPGSVVVAKADATVSISDSIALGGIGGSLRVPLIADKLSFGAKGLYGPGMGRYGNSTLADVTANSWGGLGPIHNLSGLFTLEANPTPRLAIYLNYGGDYASRADYSTPTSLTLGSPAATFCPAGFTAAGQCVTAPTAAQLAGGGAWGGHWSTPTAQQAVGYGSRFPLSSSNSGCNTTTAPGYNTGGSTGFLPGGSCGAQTRDVQEVTGGYWYDIYKGDRGRLRQSVQYGYAVRDGWGTGTAGIGAKGIDNMFWTSFRYYLP